MDACVRGYTCRNNYLQTVSNYVHYISGFLLITVMPSFPFRTQPTYVKGVCSVHISGGTYVWRESTCKCLCIKARDMRMCINSFSDE